MFTKNLIITFLSLVIGILTYFKFNSDNNIQENYIDYHLSGVPEKIHLNQNTGDGYAACNSCNGGSSRYSLPGNSSSLSYGTQSAPTKYSKQGKEHYATRRGMTKGMNKGAEFYTVPGTYQANLSPRMMSQGFGGNINYNAPAQKNMALRANDPMMLANSVEKPSLRENFAYSSGGVASAGLQAADSLSGNNLSSTFEAPPLPAPTMSNYVDLAQDNVITYDRYMWSTSYDRNAAQGDFIRGDIAIIPNVDCKEKWFVTSSQLQPHKVLQTGAMAVMGGIDNSTAQQTASLVMQSLGGSNLSAGGVGWEGASFIAPPNTPIANLVNPGASYMMASDSGNPPGTAAATAGVVTTAYP